MQHDTLKTRKQLKTSGPAQLNRRKRLPKASVSAFWPLMMISSICWFWRIVLHRSATRYSMPRTAPMPFAFCEECQTDIILLDKMMPKMNGCGVCQMLRETYPVNEMPVNMITARNQVTDLVERLGAGPA